MSSRSPRRAARPRKLDLANAWIGLEPTFTSTKAVHKWEAMAGTRKGEDAYFHDPYMVRTERRLGRSIQRKYLARRAARSNHCLFDRVELSVSQDEFGVERQELDFQGDHPSIESFNVRVGLDPEVFEYSVQPIPLPWFYDDQFIGFLQEFLWDVPQSQGLVITMAQGGGQFHASAKTLLQGTLLVDDIAYRLGHPELATWICDRPDPDSRPFRATRQRHAAFRAVIDQYWRGCFHPRAIGVLRAENALLDRGFDPAPSPPRGLVHRRNGPVGTRREVFQNNFAFGRAVRLRAQNMHPGYWQAVAPDDDCYHADQIMRYSEGNLNRLQIRGELHVKSGKPLETEGAPELDASLDATMLTKEASWEYRAQMSRTSARDYTEAVLLEMHHLQYLHEHPHVVAASSLYQDQLLEDAERTLVRCRRGRMLAKLHREARELNLEMSSGRIRSDWVEPETLFWAVWKALSPGARAEIAHEAVSGFLQRVMQASSHDPRRRERPHAASDPMEWHRHRVHPELWRALVRERVRRKRADPVRRELEAWQARRAHYMKRRPPWTAGEERPPWR